ncbi:MAG: hypothetical protein MUE76_09365 [Syntrophales bacterium]|nr:hypothetical protein [Syntrophales bacterium]
MEPAMAESPYRTLFAPRTTSMRSISDSGISSQLIPAMSGRFRRLPSSRTTWRR